MNFLDYLTEIPEFLRNCQYTNLLLAAEQETSDAPLIQRLNIHENVAGEFKQNLIKFIDKSLPDIRFSEYIPGYKPDKNEFCYLNLASEPQIADLIEVISQIEQPEIFSEQDEVIEKLKFYTIICSNTNQEKSIFFRIYSPKKELTRSGLFALMMNKGQYNTINNKIFLFDEDIDCFTWNGFLFIKNVYYFQRIFNYFEQIRNKATETINLVISQIQIENLEEFKKACTSQLSMMEKLARIASKTYLQSITMPAIQQTIREFQLGIEIRDEKLVFDSHPTKRWLILKLLDDDYLGSTMTGERYEVNSKRPMAD